MWHCGSYTWLGGWMMGNSLWGLLLLAGMGALIWTMLRNRREGISAADRSDSLEILKLRLAKGEITIEEYNTLKSIL